MFHYNYLTQPQMKRVAVLPEISGEFGGALSVLVVCSINMLRYLCFPAPSMSRAGTVLKPNAKGNRKGKQGKANKHSGDSLSHAKEIKVI